MALSLVVAEIFNVDRYRDLDQGSIKVIESGTIRYTGYSLLLVVYNNFVPKTHHFWDFWLQKFRDLENRVMGPSRSL